MSTYNPYSLSGKVILVTGASSGIGAIIAIECSRMGASLVITGRNEQRLSETFNALDFTDDKNHTQISSDLSTESGITHLLSSLPTLDGIVHCAGFLKKLPLQYTDAQALHTTFSVNFFAPALLMQLLTKRRLLNQGASVIFISSIASRVASVGNISYMASKGAINSFSRGIALELSSKGIRSNVIEPALILTGLSENALNKEDLDNYLQKFPLKRFGKPEEVAFAAIFLLSDASSWITGTSLVIDGGVTLK